MMHQTIKGVTEDLEHLRYNTAIAKLMTYYNFLAKQEIIGIEEREVYLKLFAPFAPHMTEELFQEMRDERGEVRNEFKSIHTSSWPLYDEKYLVQDVLTVAVQVNGKLRGTVAIGAGKKDNKELVVEKAKAETDVRKFLTGEIRKVIYVPGKILNFVI